MADWLRVKMTCEVTGKVLETEVEIDLSSLTVPELQEKMRDIYKLEITRADAERLIKGKHITLFNYEGMTIRSWGNA